VDPQRWLKIESLYHAALAKEPGERVEYLAAACSQDLELQREVESLLDCADAPLVSPVAGGEQNVSGNDMEWPAWEVAPSLLAEETVTPLAVGARLGPYQIESLLGAGGMGQVYKARDTRLGRAVAIKITHRQFSQRFERESRAISALNHPHICTVHDVGPNYLVMELVEGETLAARLCKGALPMELALRYGVQIADAVAAAHAHGITHRDLKPANIMVTKSGIKVLDFGLAKMAPRPNAPEAEPLTAPQAVMGTLAYMAPEQLEGKPADTRSDIFAFGLVLYEVLAGRAAFLAGSQAEPLPLSTLQPMLTAALDRVVRKCMAKDPDARWQTAADLHDELRWISETPAETGLKSMAPAAPSARRPAGKWLPAALVLAIGLASAIFWQSSRAPTPAIWVATRLGGPSTAFSPRISPDGQLLAFLTLVSRQSQVAVMKSDGSSWTLLTTQKDAGYAQEVYWAPDGSKIYFYRYSDQPRGVYSIPVLGGEPRLLRDNAMGGYPLPDGSLIVAAVAGQGDLQLRRFWPESGREELLPAFLDRRNDDLPVTVFPGGKEIAFFGIFSTSPDHIGTAGLYALDLDSKRARPLGGGAWTGFSRAMSATPDGKSLITLAQVEDVWQVVKVSRDGGLRHEVLFPLPRTERIFVLSAGTDGSVYVDAVVRPRLMLRFSPAGGDPEENPVGNMEGYTIGLLPGGKILFPALSGGKAHLVAGLPGAEALPLLQTGEESTFPFAASTGGRVALLLGTPPRQQIAIASAREGRILKRLTIKATEVRSVALSPDTQTLYYAAGGAVWSLPVSEAAPPRRIVEGDEVVIDPSGRFLYVMQRAKDPRVLARVPAAGGAAEPIPIPEGFHFTPESLPANAVDAQGRVLFETSSADLFFYSTALFDAAKRSVTRIPLHFEGDTFSPIWTPDGRIAAVGDTWASSIWRYHPVKER